jgi:hypothetical protein
MFSVYEDELNLSVRFKTVVVDGRRGLEDLGPGAIRHSGRTFADCRVESLGLDNPCNPHFTAKSIICA